MADWNVIRPADTPHPFALALSGEDAVFVSGIGGHEPDGDISEDVVEQARRAIQTVRELLEQAGSSLDEIVWFHPYVTVREHAFTMDEVLRETFGDTPPASGALVICDLADPRMKLEFEAVAVRGARRVESS